MSGAYVDQWAHRHRADLESFFTPWHALLYSGFLATSAYLVWHMVRGGRSWWSWRDSRPSSYHWSIAGVTLFMVAGVGDMLWHEIFGIEVGTEALVSPTHLLLAIGAGMIVTGPLRACWQRSDQVLDLPSVLSAGLTLSLLTFFTVYSHPFVRLSGSTNAENSFGLTGILLQSLLVCGLVLMMLVRFRLLPGTLTFIFGLSALFLSLMEYTYVMVLVGLAVGITGDVLVRWLNPAPHRVMQFRVFACSLPVVFWIGYFAALLATDGIAWTIHLWTGAIVQAGIFGWLLSYLVVPPGREG
jgi:hypothetical protein